MNLKTKNLVFCFAFLSVCTTLPLAKIGGTSESKINHDLFCASLGLHYLCKDKRNTEM